MKGHISINNVVPPYKANKENFRTLLGAMIGVAVMTGVDYNDPKVRQAIAKIEAIEPSVAKLARIRKMNLAEQGNFDVLLADIREGNLSKAEIVSIAKIVDSNLRIGAAFIHGEEGITGPNFLPAITTRMATGPQQDLEYWAADDQVKRAFKKLQDVVAVHLEVKGDYLLN